MKVHTTATMFCPTCNHKLNACAAAPGGDEDRPPQRGDATICVRCASKLWFDELVENGQRRVFVRLMTDEEYAALNAFDRNGLDKFVDHIKNLPPGTNFDVKAIRDKVAIAQVPFTDEELDAIAHVAYESERAYATLVKAADNSDWPPFTSLPPSLVANEREVIRVLLGTGEHVDEDQHVPGDCRMIYEVTCAGFAQMLRDILRNRKQLLFQAESAVVIRKLVVKHHISTKGQPYVGVVNPELAQKMGTNVTIVDDLEIRDEILNLFKSHSLPVYDGPDGVLIVQDSAMVTPTPAASA